MKTIYIVLKEDIIYYPPIISIINTLLDLGNNAVHLGTYSDREGRAKLEKKGAKFVKMPSYRGKGNLLQKLTDQIKFKRCVEKFLSSTFIGDEDLIWIAQIETIYLLHNLVYKYPVILHPLEFTDKSINWKYRAVSPTINLKKVFHTAKKVVCCEYNRSHITKGIFALDTLPYILPNKPYEETIVAKSIPSDISKTIHKYLSELSNKKIILYQGVFVDGERRLEEFCQAISLLPEEYVLIAMGSGTALFENLKLKYEGTRIKFIPFIKPPYHLLITKEAYIGVLSYFPRQDNIGTVLNPLYCAPNKVFEYAKFGKPMLGNDIPGLHYMFQEYHCGECIQYPMTPKTIAETVLKLDSYYSTYSVGSAKFYNSVSIPEIISQIVSD